MDDIKARLDFQIKADRSTERDREREECVLGHERHPCQFH